MRPMLWSFSTGPQPLVAYAYATSLKYVVEGCSPLTTSRWQAAHTDSAAAATPDAIEGFMRPPEPRRHASAVNWFDLCFRSRARAARGDGHMGYSGERPAEGGSGQAGQGARAVVR